METINRVPSKIIEIEINIKMLEYLKRNFIIDDGMYNYVVNKLMNKVELEKSKIDNDYIRNINNYKFLI